MSTGAPDSARQDSGEWLRKRLPGVVIVLLLTALFYHLYLRSREYFVPSEQAASQHNETEGSEGNSSPSNVGFLESGGYQPASTSSMPGKSQPADGRSAVISGEAEAELARNRTRVIEAYDLGQRIASKLSDIEKELTSWTAVVSALNDSQNDLGRRVAARQELVQQYSALVAAQTTTTSDLQTWTSQLEAIHSRVAPAYKDNRHVAVTQEDIELLSRLEEKVSAQREQLRQHRRILGIIQATAERVDPGQSTLKQSLEALQAGRDEALRIKLAEAEQDAVREVEEKYATQIAEERRKQQELLKQQQLEAERLESGERQKELAEIQRRRKEIEDRIAAEKLEAEYRRDLPSMKSLLAPFFAKAITQPAPDMPISKGGLMKPTSLGALRGAGALAETNEGLEFLFHVGGHPANMREKGSFPTFTSLGSLGPGTQREQVRKAQQYLIKYGELLVRDGLLSK